ncbi:MAG TPA: restriction endonuclease subunit S [Bacteroidales bacterium]|nr:restriction endonuclease subunit S [Bacteroidales bacterium]HQB21669.1 restriction endonuclease subunit S [Bacteroidales bacterium]
MNWKKIKLGEILKNREGRYKPNDPTITGLKRINKINFLGEIYLSEKKSNTDMILIKKGDLVISGINVEKGALAIYEGNEDILATIHYSSYIFEKNKIDIDFLKIFLKSPDFIQLLKEQVPGGIKTEIKPKHLLPLEVYFPENIEDQKTIAFTYFKKEALINQINEHISHQLTHIENLTQAILQEAVQGKLVPQDPNDEPATELLKRIKAEKKKVDNAKKQKPLPPIKPEEIPFEIPDSWMWCRLGEIIDMFYGESLIKTQRTDNGKYPVFGSNGIVGYHDKYLTDKRTIIVGRKGSAGALNVCQTPSWTTDVAYYIEEETLSDFDFTYYLLKSLKIEELAKGVKPGINRNEVYNIPIPLPPLLEQKRIVAEIEKQLAKTEELKKYITSNQESTEQLLKALLHEAFEGGK